MGGANGFISALAQLVGALAWPGVVIVVLVLFRAQFGGFISNLGSLSFQGGGVKLSLNRAVQAAAALGAATAARASKSDGAAPALADPRGITAALPDARQQKKLQGARILWVDDNPQNDQWDRQVLEALGMTVDWATSTDEALTMASRQRYDLVISDMEHPQGSTPPASTPSGSTAPASTPPASPDAQGGLTLLDQLRRAGQTMPFIIYTHPQSPDGTEALRRGATAFTTMPDHLLSAAVRALSPAS